MQFKDILEDIDRKMSVRRKDHVLDLCCGNGLITAHLAQQCARIVGVDFAEDLTKRIDLDNYPNLSVVVEDIRKVQFPPESFNKTIIYAGIQYLTLGEAVTLFEEVFKWTCRDGMLLVGDIPDNSRLWEFSNSAERRAAYFESMKNGAPIIGTWFDPLWLKYLGEHVGFRQADCLAQPPHLPYSHYRFDAIFRK